MLQFCLSAILGAALLFAAPWTPPRTSWGDPDLQGTYTNNNEYATPLERPAEFAGKRASDLTAAELAEVRRVAQQRMVAGTGKARRLSSRRRISSREARIATPTLRRCASSNGLRKDRRICSSGTRR